MKKSKVAIPLLVIVFALSAHATLFGPDTFQEACRVGANARVEFKVLDDTGNPVQGVAAVGDVKVAINLDPLGVEFREVVGVTEK